MVRAAIGCYLFGALQVLALQLQPIYPGLSQILPILPFTLMIFTMVLVYLDWLGRLGDRHPAWRRLLASDPLRGWVGYSKGTRTKSVEAEYRHQGGIDTPLFRGRQPAHQIAESTNVYGSHLFYQDTSRFAGNFNLGTE